VADLTLNAENFLALCARTDDRKERIQAYRDMKMPGHDASTSTVSRRITKLLVRDDSIAFLEAAREDARRGRAGAMAAADAAGWEEQAAKARLNRLVVESLTRVLAARTDEIEADPRKSAADISKLAEIAHRVAGEASDAPPMSAEDRRAQLKDAGIDLDAEVARAAGAPEAEQAGDEELLFDAKEGVA